ncbi:MAG: rod shape-determining protein MreD [Chakrabartia sp.]
MARGYNPRLNRQASRWALIGIPTLSVMLGSMTTLWPSIALYPLLPPMGLLMLLGWRTLVRDIWPVWVALPLGLFDDLFSGQPLGSAMLLWTIVFLVLDIFDRWMMWRDYRQDWAIAGSLITIVLVLGLGIANTTGGQTSLWLLLPQIAASILAFPAAVRMCAALDRLRWRL